MIDVLVNVGDTVNKGDALVLVEAMKMEHRHIADGNGVVKKVNVEKGQQVKNRQLLIELAFIELDSTRVDNDETDLNQQASVEKIS